MRHRKLGKLAASGMTAIVAAQLASQGQAADNAGKTAPYTLREHAASSRFEPHEPVVLLDVATEPDAVREGVATLINTGRHPIEILFSGRQERSITLHPQEQITELAYRDVTRITASCAAGVGTACHAFHEIAFRTPGDTPDPGGSMGSGMVAYSPGCSYYNHLQLQPGGDALIFYADPPEDTSVFYQKHDQAGVKDCTAEFDSQNSSEWNPPNLSHALTSTPTSMSFSQPQLRQVDLRCLTTNGSGDDCDSCLVSFEFCPD